VHDGIFHLFVQLAVSYTCRSGIFLMVLFYATPIVYSAESFASMPKAFSIVLRLNPMTHIINGYRSIFYYKQMPNLIVLSILLGIAIIVCIVGYIIFNKLQKRFAEEL
jgi:ABC-2 type transport system permease protein